MEYITTKCPDCGYTFEFMTPKSKIPELGVPYRICPECKRILINKYQKEIIQRPNFKNEYYTKYSISLLILIFFIWIVIRLGLGEIIDSLLIIFLITTALCSLIVVYLTKNIKYNYNKLFSDSINRLRNKEYVNLLLKLNLLNKDDILKFKEKYRYEYSLIETNELKAFVGDIDHKISIAKNEIQNDNTTYKEASKENDGSKYSANIIAEKKVMYCRKCGFKLDEDVVYCRKCGNKVR